MHNVGLACLCAACEDPVFQVQHDSIFLAKRVAKRERTATPAQPIGVSDVRMNRPAAEPRPWKRARGGAESDDDVTPQRGSSPLLTPPSPDLTGLLFARGTVSAGRSRTRVITACRRRAVRAINDAGQLHGLSADALNAQIAQLDTLIANHSVALTGADARSQATLDATVRAWLDNWLAGLNRPQPENDDNDDDHDNGDDDDGNVEDDNALDVQPSADRGTLSYWLCPADVEDVLPQPLTAPLTATGTQACIDTVRCYTCATIRRVVCLARCQRAATATSQTTRTPCHACVDVWPAHPPRPQPTACHTG